MAVKKHGVHFDITAENATDRALRAVESNLKGINQAADAVGRTLQGAFVATAAIAAGKAFAAAAMEAEQASRRLDAVLKATGHSAGLTKAELDELADSLAESTQFDDESLRNAAAQLLKFGNIHGQTFREAMKLSADLAAFMGTDVVSAVQSVGKALTSPKEGTMALEKQIGKFNPAAKQMIEALAEQGRTAEAQAAVLEVLKGKIGGAAEALNTGLTKASRDAKKQWDEMLESIGKTEAFQKVAKSGLNFIEQSFRDIKEIVENGDWVEKTLAILAFAGGWRGMKLTPPEQEGRREVSGRIPGGIGPKPAKPPIRTILTKEELADVERQARERERAAAEAKRLEKERLSEAEKASQAHVELEEMAAQESREAWEAYTKQRLEQEEQIRKAREAGMKAWFETIDMEQERAIEEGEAFLQAERDRKEALKEQIDIARELGLTFTSAFEDAILEGKKFSDVLKGIANDIGRLILRKSVTEPAAKAVVKFIEGIDWKGIFGARADGGPVEAGTPYMVGERGPELMVPGASGTVVPNHALRSMSAGGSTYYIDARGADRTGLQRLEDMLRALNGSVEHRAVSAVLDARRRGGSFAAAFA